MRDPAEVRNDKESISDNLLLMYLLGNARSSDLGITKLAKLIYLIESRLGENKIKTFNYNFQKDNFGPFTKEIYDDLELLNDEELVTPVTMKLTKRGREVLAACDELFESNSRTMESIDRIIHQYEKKRLYPIKKEIYESKILVRGRLKKVKNLPKGTDLNAKISDSDAISKFDFDNGWEETLYILRDKEFSESLSKASESVKIGRTYSYDEVFDPSRSRRKLRPALAR